MKFFIIIILTFAALIAPNISNAEDNQINIESDELIVDQNPTKSIFTGNVYAHDSEIKIWSDKIVVTFYGADNKIDTIEGQGRVKLIRGDEEIIADLIFYELRKSTIKARGNITANQSGNIIIGDQLNIDLINSTTIIKSLGSNRVKATILKKND